ncbi:terpene synthase family protein [Algoriphagus formosus]|uniref:Terpene synthase n=1 Tax=Algoriphagus formosus TaxID=2007308 RepID=A0A4R5VEI6_9BACT|nr:hypothetical protein [Algoriphagus aquimaris]TDK50837.1 hypothetical protein E1898_00460 [Algoriphagus aquimaris]
MEAISWKPVQLRVLLGLEGKADISAFQKLGEYLTLSELPEKSVIRHAGEVETQSHVLIEGLVGMYQSRKLVRLFFPGDMFLDYESYQLQVPSRFEFRAMYDSVFTNLDFEKEELVLKEIPDMKSVSENLIKRVRHANEQWIAFTQLHHVEKLKQLEAKNPKILFDLKDLDLANILGTSDRTVQRIRRKRKEEERISGNWKDRLQGELKYPFEAAIHPNHKTIIAQTITWATVFHNLLRSPEELKAFHAQKLGLLSCYLYPETELDTAIWVAKLYTWLFYLDDMTDHIPKGQKAQFWKWISQGMDRENLLLELHTLPGRVWELIRIWYELRKELEGLENMSESKLSLVEEEVQAFIQYNLKEALLKDSGGIPDASQYMMDKPFYSGARLAVNFTCLDIGDEFDSQSEDWKKSQVLRELGAKLIFLSNDLISFRKERKKGDSMNYLSILIRKNSWNFRKAEAKVLMDFQETLQEFLKWDRKIRSDFDPGNLWQLHCLKQIKYKVAGSNHWSFHVTTRYE